MPARQLARLAVLTGYFGLFILTLLWVTWLSPPARQATSLTLLVFVGPLLFPLRGLLHGKTSTHVWTAMLVLFYFIHGVVEAWASSGERGLALIELGLSLLLFGGCVAYVRLSNK